jgi:ribosomal protein S18 acetylase RimI-like enzyme
MDMGFIRKIEPSDLNKIIEIENKCFKNFLAYSPKQLKYLITRANSNCLLELLKDTPRGFIILLLKRNSELAGIETLNVDPIHQGKGIGKKLLKAAEDEMLLKGIKKIRLEVSTNNKCAINLYEKSGFRKTAFLKDYYKHEHYGSHDAFRFVKLLTT